MKISAVSALIFLTALGCSGTPSDVIAPDIAPSEQATPRVQQEAQVPETALLPEIDVKFTKFKLKNGLTVIVHEDHKAPVVAVNVWYRVGSKDESVGKTGFAHLFEHLMFQGSENFQGEFFEPLEKAGATDMNGTTNQDRTNYFETVPTPALDMALWMESDRMGHFSGAISQARLDEQRGVVQNEMRQGQNRPYGKARFVIPKNTYPLGHPYSWTVIGSMDDLNAASLTDVKDWFAQYYGAANAVVVLAGDITPDQAREKMNTYFGDIAPGPAIERRGPWIAPMTENKSYHLTDNVPQERVYMVYNLPNYGTRATEQLRLALAVLGTGKNSRLFKKLVYEEELATHVSTYLSGGMLGSQAYITVDARKGVKLKDLESALNKVMQEFLLDGPTQEELDRARMRYFSNLVTRLERVSGKSDLLAKSEVLLGDAGGFRKVQKHLKEASPKSVREAAEYWLGSGVFVLRISPAAEFAKAPAIADRTSVPSAGDAPSLTLPPIQRTTLTNGVEVILAERHDAPTVRVQVVCDQGFSTDGAQLGRAKLAVDLMDEGTKNWSSLGLSAELERLGARMSASTGLDRSNVSLTTLTTTLAPSLDLLAEVVTLPAFRDAEVERRRKQHLAAIEQERANPFQTALRVLGPLLFGAHQYGRPLTGSGTPATVNALKVADLQNFHARVFRPGSCKIIVVGDTTLKAVKPLLEERLRDWKSSAEPFASNTSAPPKRDSVSVYLINKPKAEQTLIVAGNVFGSRKQGDEIAVEAMNAIIGGTFMSRINMNLREDKHWSYGARSFIYETNNEQVFGAYANVQSDKSAESVKEIKKEITAYLGRKPATQDELQRTRDNRIRKLPGQNETSGRLLGSISKIIRYGLPDNYYETYVARYQALTKEIVASTAQIVIKPDTFVWVIVGDLKVIEPKIRALKLGEVTVIEAP